MRNLSRAWESLRSLLRPSPDVRAETWALGARHRGEVVAGARLELKAPGITTQRARLLRAVIRHRQRQAPTT